MLIISIAFSSLVFVDDSVENMCICWEYRHKFSCLYI